MSVQSPHVFIYTSGTTGLPKAAKISHLRFMTAPLLAIMHRVQQQDRWYCALPLYHSAGGMVAVASVIHLGATLVLRRKFSATHFWSDCVRYEATIVHYIGEICRYLLNQPAGPHDHEHKVVPHASATLFRWRYGHG
jgi:acyl-CoA synthetase (AMP-forming)/AMP-acid ligase II